MLQSCTVTENLAVTCLAHARGARDDYVGFALRHEFEGVDRWDMTISGGFVLIRDVEVEN